MVLSTVTEGVELVIPMFTLGSLPATTVTVLRIKLDGSRLMDVPILLPAWV